MPYPNKAYSPANLRFENSKVILDDLSGLTPKVTNTPQGAFLSRTTRAVFDLQRDSVSAASRTFPGVQIAYSIKTNPNPMIVDTARRAGFLAEATSPEEVNHALELGFTAEQIIYNGPIPTSRLSAGKFLVAFADSVNAFVHNWEKNLSKIQGIRVRPPNVPTRFGVPDDELSSICEIAKKWPRETPLGVHFHVRRADFGAMTWQAVLEAAVDRAADIQASTGLQVQVFDIGGSFVPGSLANFWSAELPLLERLVRKSLPHVRHVFLEAGQAVAEPCECVFTRVLEIRRSRNPREIIVDAGYPHLSQMYYYFHRMFYLKDGEWRSIDAGVDRFLGPTCIENDWLSASVSIPDDLVEGDLIAVCDAGAYDSSMRFPFAKGLSAAGNLLYSDGNAMQVVRGAL